jgi:voltage-gated potassium channel
MPRPLRARIHDIMFQHDSPAERAFDGTLVIAIVLSVTAVMLDSVAEINARYGHWLLVAEWCFTVLFTVEYLLRLASVRHPRRYMTSTFGLIDLLAVFPTWLSLVLPGAQNLLVLRSLRLLRIFRILKLAEYLREASVLWQALRASRRKIFVFLLTVVTIVVVVGALMYVIEGEAHGFTSIPLSIYWAVVTLTTVGYGDLAPATVPGRVLATIVMLLGYGIIAVPTGIVTAELTRSAAPPVSTQACPGCGIQGHEVDAAFCRRCGTRL